MERRAIRDQAEASDVVLETSSLRVSSSRIPLHLCGLRLLPLQYTRATSTLHALYFCEVCFAEFSGRARAMASTAVPSAT